MCILGLKAMSYGFYCLRVSQYLIYSNSHTRIDPIYLEAFTASHFKHESFCFAFPVAMIYFPLLWYFSYHLSYCTTWSLVSYLQVNFFFQLSFA